MRLRRALAPVAVLALPVAASVWLAQVLLVAGGAAPSGPPPVLDPPVVAAQPVAGAVLAATPAPASAPAPPAGTASSAPAVSGGWVASVAAASGISAVAVAAYGRAVLTQPPGCDLGWTTLAGVGWVESEQGTVGGRVLQADGRPSAAILGPALDGRDYAAIPATTAGADRWDHAVGPMQFLPSTWATWGRDGDGDGVADPEDLDDAAAAAAAYLCGTGQDLTTGLGWSAAVYAYNHSDTYVRQVYAAAQTYADRTAGSATGSAASG